MSNPLKFEGQIIYLGFIYRFSQKLKAAKRRERKATNENRAWEGEQ